jgi:hypothetical protein
MLVLRKLFPKRPLLGLALVALIAVEGVALAAHLCETEKHAEEGAWKPANPPYTVSGNVKKCQYVRDPDACRGLRQRAVSHRFPFFWIEYIETEEVPDTAHDCWHKDPSEGGHHSTGYDEVALSGSCDSGVPTTTTGVVDIGHKYTVAR